MVKLQFRVLYRKFLFRMVDLELLSADAQGDSNKLLGQFAALLIVVSIVLSIPAMGAGAGHTPPEIRLFGVWGLEHFLIATTMLVVGLFAVLSWDSTFPDRRDVLVLAPLPVRAGTLFLAKVAAAGTALSLTVACARARWSWASSIFSWCRSTDCPSPRSGRSSRRWPGSKWGPRQAPRPTVRSS